MKEKLQQLVTDGWRVQIRTRWSDNAWGVWIYHQTEGPFSAWDNDLEVAIDKAIDKLRITT